MCKEKRQEFGFKYTNSHCSRQQLVNSSVTALLLYKRTPFISWPTFAVLSPAMWCGWDNGSYTTVDSLRLHSCRKHASYTSSRCCSLDCSDHASTCLWQMSELVNCDPYHSTAKHGKMITVVSSTFCSFYTDTALIVAKCTVFQSLCISNIRRNIKISFYTLRAFKRASCPAAYWTACLVTTGNSDLPTVTLQPITDLLHGSWNKLQHCLE